MGLTRIGRVGKIANERGVVRPVEIEGRSCLLLDCIVAARRCLGYVEAIAWLPTC